MKLSWCAKELHGARSLKAIGIQPCRSGLKSPKQRVLQYKQSVRTSLVIGKDNGSSNNADNDEDDDNDKDNDNDNHNNNHRHHQQQQQQQPR